MKNKLLLELIGAIFLLALGNLAFLAVGYLSYSHPIISTLANLRPFVAISLGLFGILFVLIRRWFRGLALIAVAMAAIVQVQTGLADLRAEPVAAAQSDLKIISFNLLFDNTANGEAIAGFIRDNTPDFAFIQEAAPLQPYLEQLSDTLPYHIGCDEQVPRCDLLFLSRHPLNDIKIQNLSDFSRWRLFTATTEVGGQKINIVAPHLTKPYNENHQYWEFRKLGNLISKIKGPVIMAGDFNSAPWSPDFMQMLEKSGMRLAQAEPGTWPVKAGDLGIPIDHVLARQPAVLASVQALPSNFGSNHRGLIAKIQLSENPD